MFKQIIDLREADELWKAGLLYAAAKRREHDNDAPYPGSWILIADYANNADTMAPSVWKVEEGCAFFYGIYLEE